MLSITSVDISSRILVYYVNLPSYFFQNLEELVLMGTGCMSQRSCRFVSSVSFSTLLQAAWILVLLK